MVAAADNMDLRMRILADGAQAVRQLKGVAGAVSVVGHATTRMAHVARASFRLFMRGIQLVLKPLKTLAGIAIVAGVGFGLLGMKSLNAAGDMEALRLRLEGVTASAEDANRVFRETVRMSVFSPFTPEQMIDARIGLLNIGQTGKAAMTTLGNAASITQRDLGDLVSILAALEAEPLRRIGVELKREAGRFEFVFRDKMQKVRKITATGIDEARKSLLSIFDIKYGGGMARFTAAWKGLLSTLQGNVKMAFAGFGEGLLPAAKGFVDALNTQLAKLIESGKLQEWGAKVGDELVNAFTYGRAVIDKTAAILTTLYTQGPGAMAEGLRIALSSAVEIAARGFVNYLAGMGSVFIGLGKIISAAFLEDVLKLPFMDNARKRFAQEGLSSMPNQEMLAWTKKNNLTPNDIYEGNFTDAQAKELIQSSRERIFSAGVQQAIGGFAQITTQNAQMAKDVSARAAGQLNALTLANTGPSVEERHAAYRAQWGAGGDEAAPEGVGGGHPGLPPGHGSEDYSAPAPAPWYERQIARMNALNRRRGSSVTRRRGGAVTDLGISSAERAGLYDRAARARRSGSPVFGLDTGTRRQGRRSGSPVFDLNAESRPRSRADTEALQRETLAEIAAINRRLGLGRDQRSGNGVTFNVHSLTVRANSAQQLRNEMLGLSGMPAVAPAGT